MADPVFSSPVTDPGVATDAVTLSDETGVQLTRRFEGSAVPGTACRHGERLEWSVSPGEWTVLGASGDGVDLTHVRAVFRLSGTDAPDVLAGICWLDLADDMFPSGAAARTSIAGVATELVRDDRDGERSYLLLPSRSFGRYLWGVVADLVAT